MVNEQLQAHFSAANTLLIRAEKSGYDYGCVEMALVALGAPFTLADLSREEQPAVPTAERLHQADLQINWHISTGEPVGINDLNYIMHAVSPDQCQEGDLAGFIWVMRHPESRGHVIAIAPDSPDTFLAFDPKAGGTFPTTLEGLVQSANHAIASGCTLEILELFH